MLVICGTTDGRDNQTVSVCVCVVREGKKKMARLGNGVFFQHECFTGMPRTAYCATFGSKQEQKHTGFLLQNPNFDQMVTAYGPRFVFGMTAAVGSDTFFFFF